MAQSPQSDLSREVRPPNSWYLFTVVVEDAANAGISKRESWPGFVMTETGKDANKAMIRIYVGSKP